MGFRHGLSGSGYGAPRRLAIWVALLAMLAAGLPVGLGCVVLQTAPPATTATEVLNFANEARLREHYLKHRGEFEPGLTQAQYLEKARKFFGDRSPQKLYKYRGNGDELHYLPRSNEFGVLSSARVIRTYFRPSSGRDYWDRQ